MEFNGFSFCKEKKSEKKNEEKIIKEESLQKENCEENEEETERKLDINRFDKNENQFKGMSFGKKPPSHFEMQDKPIPRVNCMFK